MYGLIYGFLTEGEPFKGIVTLNRIEDKVRAYTVFMGSYL
jgi:hypothetical protein